jgi:hypothetical protein
MSKTLYFELTFLVIHEQTNNVNEYRSNDVLYEVSLIAMSTLNIFYMITLLYYTTNNCYVQHLNIF